MLYKSKKIKHKNSPRTISFFKYRSILVDHELGNSLIGSQAISLFNFVEKIENSFPILIGWPQTAESRFVERCQVIFGHKLVQPQTPYWNIFAPVDSLFLLFVLLPPWMYCRLTNMGSESVWCFVGGDDQNSTRLRSLFFHSIAYEVLPSPHLVN